jgi:hypothetical protein
LGSLDPHGGRRLAALLLALAACSEHGRAAPPAASSIPAIDTASAGAPPPSASAAAPPLAVPAEPVDPDERLLREAEISALVVARGALIRRGTFQAMLGPPGDRRPATLWMALSADPIAHRRPLAFYRLARGIGARVVPATVLRHVPAGDLAGVVEDTAEAKGILRDARVLNDGTVDVLLISPASPAGPATPFDPDQAREPHAWERWAASPAPVPGEDTGLLRDYVEMLVLDYLSANVARRQALLRAGEAGGRGAIVLADNASAFPPHPEAPVLDRMLRRLRGVARFPRGLRDALLGFDRARAAAAFADGGFDTWLLAPRVRVELDERRAALLTLIEARIGERGAEAVLCL